MKKILVMILFMIATPFVEWDIVHAAEGEFMEDTLDNYRNTNEISTGRS